MDTFNYEYYNIQIFYQIINIHVYNLQTYIIFHENHSFLIQITISRFHFRPR